VDERESSESSPESARDVVEKLLAGLPPPDRLVIRLLDLEQKSVKEIASLTGWNIPLIKVRAFRARRKFRDSGGREVEFAGQRTRKTYDHGQGNPFRN